MDQLETSRLIIRPFTMDDLDDAYRLLDLDIEWAGPGRTLEWRRERLHLYVGLANWDDTGRLYGYRLLVRKDTGEKIGISGFHPDYWSPEWKRIFWPQWFPDWRPACAGRTGSFELGIGWALSNLHRGNGYASEAACALLDYAFGTIQVERVFAITDKTNEPSVNVMRRIGMRLAANPDASITYPAVAGVVLNPCAENGR